MKTNEKKLVEIIAEQLARIIELEEYIDIDNRKLSGLTKNTEKKIVKK